MADAAANHDGACRAWRAGRTLIRGAAYLLGGFADALFPPRCALCSAHLRIGEGPFCEFCLDTVLPVEPPWCARCGLPISPSGPELCKICRSSNPPAPRWVRGCTTYAGAIEEAIHKFKYGGDDWLAKPLADMMASHIPDDVNPAQADLLVPVPLHPRRLRKRGYNQSLLLGRRLAMMWEVDCSHTALRRVRDTPPQRGLDASARRSNLEGAFVVTKPQQVSGRTVLLLDDVITTGSTLNECARALLVAGARAVWALALARSVPEIYDT